MLTKTDTGSQAPVVPEAPKPGTYSPVTVHQEDTVGAIFLGITTLSLLMAFLRAEARNRALQAQVSRLRATPIEAAPQDGNVHQLWPRPATEARRTGA